MRYSAGLLAFLVTLTGHGLSDIEYRGLGVKLQISAQRMSPAFAALEDTHSVPASIQLDSSENSKKFKQEHLYAGRPETIKVQLPKVVIAANATSPLNEAIQKAHEVFVNSAPILVGTNTRQQLEGFADTTRKIKKSFNIQSPILAANTYGFRKEVNNNKTTEIQNSKSINVDGVEVLVGGENFLASNSSPKGANREVSSVGMLASASFNPNLIPQQTAKSVLNHEAERALLKGQIILADGAVYPGETFNFYIQRIFDGMTQERGAVDPYTGEFEIDVNALRGKLTVELRHETGAAIAYGELQLSKLENKNQNITELKLKMVPTDEISVIGQVLSYESFDDIEVAVAGEPTRIHLDGDEESFKTDRQGKFEEAHVTSGSQILVTASHRGFWNTIELAESGKPIQPILHSDNRMQVMMELLEPYLPRSKIYSIIWGRVSHDGAPLAGATVTLQGYEDIQPLYFNFRIPNPKATRTSGDGYFAFINPPEGLHILKATHSKVKIPYESTIVKAHHTSIAQLETAPLKPVTVNIKEAFRSADAHIAARVSAPGSVSAWWLSARKNNVINFYDRSTPMPMDIDAGPEFVSTSTFINRRRTNLDIPLVRKNWLAGVLASNKVNVLPSAGMIMGMIEDGAHRVDLSQKTHDTAIIYFDKAGRVVDRIQKGGGFIAVNVPHGVTTVSVTNSMAKTFKTLSLVEYGRLSLVSVPQSHTH